MDCEDLHLLQPDESLCLDAPEPDSKPTYTCQFTCTSTHLHTCKEGIPESGKAEYIKE